MRKETERTEGIYVNNPTLHAETRDDPFFLPVVRNVADLVLDGVIFVLSHSHRIVHGCVLNISRSLIYVRCLVITFLRSIQP